MPVQKNRSRYSPSHSEQLFISGKSTDCLAESSGEECIAAPCGKEGISQKLDYRWSKEFLEASKKRLLASQGTGFNHTSPAYFLMPSLRYV